MSSRQVQNTSFHQSLSSCASGSRFGGVQLCASPWTITRQAPLSMGILQVRILEWVARSSSRGIYPNQGLNPCLFRLLQCRRHRRCESIPELGRFPEGRQPTPVFLTGKPHGQRSLAGHSLWGHKGVGHRLQLWCVGSRNWALVVAAHGLSSCGSRA